MTMAEAKIRQMKIYGDFLIPEEADEMGIERVALCHLGIGMSREVHESILSTKGSKLCIFR